jgi:hypothetical protein
MFATDGRATDTTDAILGTGDESGANVTLRGECDFAEETFATARLVAAGCLQAHDTAVFTSTGAFGYTALNFSRTSESESRRASIISSGRRLFRRMGDDIAVTTTVGPMRSQKRDSRICMNDVLVPKEGNRHLCMRHVHKTTIARRACENERLVLEVGASDGQRRRGGKRRGDPAGADSA